MDFTHIFSQGSPDARTRAMETVSKEKCREAFPYLEQELGGELKHLSLITMAALDLGRTVPYLRRELQSIPENYPWKGHPVYDYSPLILTMEVILAESGEPLQDVLDRFKPFADRERRFFDYTLRCLFYAEPERRADISL